MSTEKQNIEKIGMICSGSWQSKRKVRDLIFKIKQRVENFELVSIGNGGADGMVKKFALEMECNYKEFNPAYTNRNLYSACHSNYYGKPFSNKYLFQRNGMYSKYIDKLVVFWDGETVLGNNIMDIIRSVEKLNKSVVIIN